MEDIGNWGKDHWSLLAYVETRCVDFGGKLDAKHFRCNPKNHNGYQIYNTLLWDNKYSTRLKARETIAGHDDWDCLDDLEEAGFIIIQSLANGFVSMTKMGMRLAGKLREHKTCGGVFHTFHPDSISEKICEGVELRRFLNPHHNGIEG